MFILISLLNAMEQFALRSLATIQSRQFVTKQLLTLITKLFVQAVRQFFCFSLCMYRYVECELTPPSVDNRNGSVNHREPAASLKS